MYILRGEIKLAAKDSMRRAKPHPMLATLVYFLITFAIGAIVESFTGMRAWYYGMIELGYDPWLYWREIYGGFAGTVAVFFNILLALFQMILQYGYSTEYALGLSRRRRSDIRSFFTGFERPARILIAQILMGIFVFLWSLLLLVPGIIAFYRYRLTLYILADNPKIRALDAIRLSKELMWGYKWQAFVLDLSFLGWLLLTPLTLGILGLWLCPYYAVTCANFYEAVWQAGNASQDYGW